MKRTLLTSLLSLLSLMVAPSVIFAVQQGSGQDGSLEWTNLKNINLPQKPSHMVPSIDGKLIYILTEDNKVLVYDNRGRLQGSIPVEAGITSIDTSPQGDVLYLLDVEKQLVSIVSVSMIVSINTTGSPFKGAAEAPVTVVVYADFQ